MRAGQPDGREEGPQSHRELSSRDPASEKRRTLQGALGWGIGMGCWEGVLSTRSEG